MFILEEKEKDGWRKREREDGKVPVYYERKKTGKNQGSIKSEYTPRSIEKHIGVKVGSTLLFREMRSKRERKRIIRSARTEDERNQEERRQKVRDY